MQLASTQRRERQPRRKNEQISIEFMEWHGTTYGERFFLKIQKRRSYTREVIKAIGYWLLPFPRDRGNQRMENYIQAYLHSNLTTCANPHF